MRNHEFPLGENLLPLDGKEGRWLISKNNENNFENTWTVSHFTKGNIKASKNLQIAYSTVLTQEDLIPVVIRDI